MIARRYARRKQKAPLIDAASCRFPSQIPHDAVGVAQQPQRAVRNATKDAHPDVEDLGRYLVRPVERAKNERVIGQSRVASFQALADLALVVVCLISAGQSDDG